MKEVKTSLRLTEKKSLKRLMSFVLFACLLAFFACNNNNAYVNNDLDDPDDDDTPTSTEYGSGTENDPFIVANKTDLKRVASGETGPGGKWTEESHYRQVADIDLSGEDWKPVWFVFEGSYDGGGYTISNLTTTGNCAFFSTVTGTMKNVRLSNLKFLHESSSGSLYWAGGMVALLAGGTLEHCYIDNVETTYNYTGSDFSSIGGLVGTNNYGTVSSCMVTNGTVSCNGKSFVGGIVGSNLGTIVNCYVTVNVSGIDSEYGFGGVAGRNRGTIENCYATGTVSSDGMSVIGGIVSVNSYIIKNCVALNQTISTTHTGSSKIGRIVGEDIFIMSSMISNNYSRNDMTLIGTPEIPVSDATTTSIHGENVSDGDYNGANSDTWWINTVDFPEDSWDFAPHRLPHLKGFNGLTQNPTVNN
ncbi:MAG: hypothetical protein FWH18_06770 [Marinilabiliaceae bacterium]|nr:hypothetical protein [Marinilabiliaceae bacterium]